MGEVKRALLRRSVSKPFLQPQTRNPDRPSGIRLHAEAAKTEGKQLVPDSDFYELTESGAMRDVLRCSRRVRPDAQLRMSDGRLIRCRVLGLTTQGDGVALRIDEPTTFYGRCTVRFELHRVVFVFEGHLQTRKGQPALRGPLRLYSLDRRLATRTPLPSGRAELIWQSLDSDEPRPGRSTVRDLTPSGIGVNVDDDGPRLPGSTFPATLRVGKTIIPCLAQTRYGAGEAGTVAGVQIRAAGLTNGLIDTYLNERNPQLVPRSLVDGDGLRRLMIDSGYLRLRNTAAQFSAWHKLSTQDLVSLDRVYVAADGALLGHVSATRVYHKTWLLHQLACLGGHAESGDCRTALYLFVASVPPLYDGTESSIVAYFNQDLRWHKLFCREFTQWTSNASHAEICNFDRFERDEPAEFTGMPAGCEVRDVRDDELVEACALIRAHLPEIAADAFDIHPLDLRRPVSSSLGRGRDVLVLQEGGKVTGVALCEMGDPNLSLFNIVNMAQVFVRTGRHAPSMNAQRALISRIRSLYAARGVDNPMLVSPADTFDACVERGTRLAERMGCMIVTGRGLRQWENFCRFHFGLRWQRHTSSAGERE